MVVMFMSNHGLESRSGETNYYKIVYIYNSSPLVNGCHVYVKSWVESRSGETNDYKIVYIYNSSPLVNGCHVYVKSWVRVQIW